MFLSSTQVLGNLHVLCASQLTTKQGNGSDALEETLGRLTKKAGVKATIVLDRVSGAILKTSGQIASVRKGNSSSLPNNQTATSSGSFSSSEVAVTANNGALNPDQGVEELAAMVWNFVSAAGGMVQELDSEVGRCYSAHCQWVKVGIAYFTQLLTHPIGRSKIVTIADEETRTRHCARREVFVDCCS